MSEQLNDTEPRVELDRFDVQLIGAWLAALRDSRGRNILLPKTENEAGNDRGGSHVCVPNFGPDEALRRHGFGRTRNWTVGSRGVNQLELVLDQAAIPDERYAGLYAVQQFAYDSHTDENGQTIEQFAVVLEAENTGQTDMQLAPAFHPYFLIDETTTLNGEKVDPADYKKAKLIEGTEFVLRTGTHEITISSDTLTTFAIWSGGDLDQPYLCVEPTHSGNSFEEGRTDDMDTLPPGKQRTYDMLISWQSLD